MAVSAREARILALLFQDQGEYPEMRRGGHALRPVQTVQCPSLAQGRNAGFSRHHVLPAQTIQRLSLAQGLGGVHLAGFEVALR